MYTVRKCRKCIVKKLKKGYYSKIGALLRKVKCRTVGYRFYCYKDKSIYELYPLSRLYDWYTKVYFTIVRC